MPFFPGSSVAAGALALAGGLAFYLSSRKSASAPAHSREAEGWPYNQPSRTNYEARRIERVPVDEELNPRPFVEKAVDDKRSFTSNTRATSAQRATSAGGITAAAPGET